MGWNCLWVTGRAYHRTGHLASNQWSDPMEEPIPVWQRINRDPHLKDLSMWKSWVSLTNQDVFSCPQCSIILSETISYGLLKKIYSFLLWKESYFLSLFKADIAIIYIEYRKHKNTYKFQNLQVACLVTKKTWQSYSTSHVTLSTLTFPLSLNSKRCLLAQVWLNLKTFIQSSSIYYRL